MNDGEVRLPRQLVVPVLRNLRCSESFPPWLYKIARSRACRELRTNPQERQIPEDLEFAGFQGNRWVCDLGWSSFLFASKEFAAIRAVAVSQAPLYFGGLEIVSRRGEERP